jgi:hypothetical protein
MLKPGRALRSRALTEVVDEAKSFICLSSATPNNERLQIHPNIEILEFGGMNII